MTGKIHKQDEGKTNLVSPLTRKRIFHSVVIAHVVVISTILLWGIIAEFFKPEPPKVITVSLYTPPGNPAPPSPPAYSPPAPKSAPKTRTKVKRPKTIPKKKVVPKPKKKVVPKPKKTWKPARTIKVSKDVVYIKPQKTWKPQPQVQKMDKQQLLASINQSRTNIRSNTTNAGAVQSYENSVGAYLYRLWDTPDKSLLGNKRPEVKIMLNIASNGQLLGAQILSPSGLPVMDESVAKLLRKIKYLPAPTGGARKVTLILEVIE